jgi:hypothetical protein
LYEVVNVAGLVVSQGRITEDKYRAFLDSQRFDESRAGSRRNPGSDMTMVALVSSTPST